MILVKEFLNEDGYSTRTGFTFDVRRYYATSDGKYLLLQKNGHGLWTIYLYSSKEDCLNRNGCETVHQYVGDIAKNITANIMDTLNAAGYTPGEFGASQSQSQSQSQLQLKNDNRVETEEWKFFVNNAPGECACGTTRSACRYHK